MAIFLNICGYYQDISQNKATFRCVTQIFL